MKALALALLLIAAKEPGPWREVAADEAGRYLLDRDSLRRSGERVTFRLAFIPAAPRPDGVVEERFEMRIHCRRRTLMLRGGLLRQATRHFADGTSESTATEVRLRGGRPAPIAAGSPQEAVMRSVCNRDGGD